MTSIVIVYATTEGQAAKIAQHIGNRGAQAGLDVQTRNVADIDGELDLARYDGVMLGGSIHEGHYQRALVRFIEQHRDALAARPTALFTVCLAIASPHPEERKEAEHFPDQLTSKTGFRPTRSAVIAGALKYTEYSWLKRALMRHIAKHEGGDTDTSRDYEYTDWAQVDRFAADFFAEVTRERTR